MIIKIMPSPRANKRFRVIYSFDNGKLKNYDFGMPGATTFIDDASEAAKQNYFARHLGNATEKRLIENKIPSPSVFSAYLLWGDSRDIDKNIRILNNLFM